MNPTGSRDEGLLESALANPVNRFLYDEEENVVALAQLIVAIGRNHPFQQGNKRTAFAAAAAFLDINGYLLSADMLQFADLFVSVLERRSGVDDLIEAMDGDISEIIEP